MPDQPATISTRLPAKLIMEPFEVVSVHDGDTVRVSAALHALWPDLMPDGFQPDVRIAHVNAAELDNDLGVAATTKVKAWLYARQPKRLHIWGREKYGRLLGDLEMSDGSMLSTYVLSLDGSRPMAVAHQLVR